MSIPKLVLKNVPERWAPHAVATAYKFDSEFPDRKGRNHSVVYSVNNGEVILNIYRTETQIVVEWQ